VIRRIFLKNFQSHASTELEFSPNVNVIMGTSNSGKSAIIRAFRWCLTNKPKGFGFRRHNIKNKEITSSAIMLEDGSSISRRRNATSTNEYLIIKEDQTVLEAMRGIVPEEVSQLTNLTSLNIQSQFTPYFLIADTAGEVARTLNEYTGLEIIDKVLQAANGAVSTASSMVNSLDTQIQEQTAELADLEYIVKLKDPVNTLQQKIDRYQQKCAHSDNLLPMITAIQSLITEKSEASKIIKYKKKVERVAEKLNVAKERRSKITELWLWIQWFIEEEASLERAKKVIVQKDTALRLEKRLLEYNDIKKQRKNLTETVIELKEAVAQQKTLETGILKHKDTIKKCHTLLEQAKQQKAQLSKLSKYISDLSAGFNELTGAEKYVTSLTDKLSKVKVCPLCHQKLTKELV
jgi:exonuclease SbcC